MRKLFCFLALVVCLFSTTQNAHADYLQSTPVPENFSTGDCVIRWFDSSMVVHQDSSGSVTETLEVDCGQIPNKHGIFRTIPFKFSRRSSTEYSVTPITLKSITDRDGAAYEVSTSYGNGTVTWKIGSALTQITGVHTYVIQYDVENIIDHADSGDTIAWNFTGNFWDLDIERFTGKIQFPNTLTDDQITPNLKSGPAGATTNTLATGRWETMGERLANGPTYYIQSIDTLTAATHSGITLFATTPHVFDAYHLPFLMQYGREAWFFLPLLVLLLALSLWSRYGRDPRPPGAQVAYYEPPRGLRPLQLGMIDTYGRLSGNFVTATIIDLAARGCISITNIPKKNFFTKADWEFTLLNPNPPVLLYEKEILQGVFPMLTEGSTIKASSLSNVFYTHLKTITVLAKTDLQEQDILDKAAETRQLIMATVGVILLIVAGIFFASMSSFNPMTNWFVYAPYAVGISAIVLLVISALMGRRSDKGAQIEYELKGFKMFLSATEKYRGKFNEEQGIFEKLLPYAILFGITEQFINGMRSMYSEEQLRGMYPAWYLMSGGTGGFADFNSFASDLTRMSDQVGTWAQSTPSSSGSGGGGFSGGGFGGGGGGSW